MYGVERSKTEQSIENQRELYLQSLRKVLAKKGKELDDYIIKELLNEASKKIQIKSNKKKRTTKK